MSGSEDTSIDELLRHEEDPAPAGRPARPGAVWVLKAAVGAALLAGLTVLALRVVQIGVAFSLAFAGCFGLLALRRLVREVAPQPLPRVRAHRGEETGDYHWGGADGLRLALSRWEIRLDWASSDVPRFARVMLPALADVVDERLRQRHGITRASNPARARTLLGDPLWTLLSRPLQRPLTPRQLDAMISQLERI